MNRRRRNTTIIAVGLLVLMIAGLVGMTWGNLRFSQENPGRKRFPGPLDRNQGIPH